ncbi:MAG TPA: DUF3943 domain-containing protein [Fibrobacteria bacterium]|nr:DUF3943 domain-containing protein [Fibrobacteria bacterium]
MTTLASLLFGCIALAPERPGDTAVHEDTLAKPAYVLPLVQIVGANAFIGAFNNHVRRQPYADIDGGTIWRNLSHEWVWDDNNFEVNQIGHPVQGGMYYSFARANGHGYLAGLAYTTLGSLQWEYFMETEPPAFNDLVTTRMGGTMLGEASWRLALALSGESTGESVGWLRRLGAGLVNPVFGADRLLNGSPSRTRQGGSSRLMGLHITNSRVLGKGWTSSKGNADRPSSQVPLASTSLRLVHGDPFEAKKPMDHFSMILGASILRDPVANVSVRGQLWKLDIFDADHSRHILELTQNYDFLNSSIYRISANSLGVEWMSDWKLPAKWRLWGRIQPVFIALGAASTEYYLNVERDYNLGMGAGWKTGFVLRRPGFGMVAAFSDRYWIHTQSGAPGDELVDIHSVELEKELYKGLGIGVSYNVYDRFGHYLNHPNSSIINQEFRGNLTFTL